jgi:hypothetical protein
MSNNDQNPDFTFPLVMIATVMGLGLLTYGLHIGIDKFYEPEIHATVEKPGPYDHLGCGKSVQTFDLLRGWRTFYTKQCPPRPYFFQIK